MNKINIEGQILKIKTKDTSKLFFDFEFSGETDEETMGLICFTQISNPFNLHITKLNSTEFKELSLDNVIQRIKAQTNKTDIIAPKIIRFKRKDISTEHGFQAFFKEYESATPIYESIFDANEEAIMIDTLSIEEFEHLGGKIMFLP